jgi:DNA-directed RNA polymerase sigma subunit (sigma70/sigma32)
MQESCALDVADRGGSTLEEVGLFTALTWERIRQIEAVGLAKIKALSEMAALMDYVE